MMVETGFGHMFGDIAAVLRSEPDFEGLVRRFLELIEITTGLESAYFTRIDVVRNLQTIVYSRNSGALSIPEGLAVVWGDTLCKRALEEGRPYTTDVADCWGDSVAARELGIRTYLSTPVRLDQEIYGTLCGASDRAVFVDERNLELLTLFGELISHNLERERMLLHLEQANVHLAAMSATDALTRLPNRRAAIVGIERLFAEARRTGDRIAIAYLDLDGFKQMNDLWGHRAGDAMLVEVGQRLAGLARSSDVIGRLGGDEFVLARSVTGSSDAGSPEVRSLDERLRAALTGAFSIDGRPFDYEGPSIGIVVAEPDGSGPESALADADAAMYADKRARRPAAH